MSKALDAIIQAKNPKYAIKEVVNLFPFQVGAEMLGKTAGRIYLREQSILYAATMSDYAMRQLRDHITAALRKRRQ